MTVPTPDCAFSDLAGKVAFWSTPAVPPRSRDGRNRRKGDPERAVPKVRFRHDRRHSHFLQAIFQETISRLSRDGFVWLSPMPREPRPN